MLEFFKTYPARYWKWYLSGVLALLLTNYVTVLIPRELEKAIDLINTNLATRDNLLEIVWYVVILSIALLAVRTISRILVFFPGRFVEFDIRNDLFKKLMLLGHEFYSKEKTGDLMSRLINDIQHLRLMVGFAALAFGNTAIMFAFALYQMFQISPLLACYTIAPVPIIILFILLIVRYYQKAILVNQEKLGSLTDNVVEAYSGVNIVKSFGVETNFIDVFELENQDYQNSSLLVAFYRSVMFPMLAVIGSIGHFVLFFAGGPMIIRGELSLGEFTAFSAYISLLAWPTASLAYMISVYQRGKVALARISAILKVKPSIKDTDNVKSELDINAPPEIIVKNLNVRFSDSKKDALENISVDIPAGSTLGIFGPTGSGKSVLARALARTIPLKKENIYINGEDILDWPLSRLRAGLSYVPQTSFLFSETIENNIAYASNSKATADRSLVEKAAKKASVHEDILLFPKAYKTLIGEKGIVLSGGQKNRLTLARAFFKPHKLLILDDVLSSVDHDTEQKLISELTNTEDPKTLIIISHRISALTKCDNIIVLENGHLTASGTHEELIQQPGIYADTWSYQNLVAA